MKKPSLKLELGVGVLDSGSADLQPHRGDLCTLQPEPQRLWIQLTVDCFIVFFKDINAPFISILIL